MQVALSSALRQRDLGITFQKSDFCGYPAFSFPTVTQVLPSANSSTVWYKRKTRYLIEITGFYLVAGARFELTTFRL
jgi:hypothetical protein